MKPAGAHQRSTVAWIHTQIEPMATNERVYIDGLTNLFFFSSRRRHTRLQGDWSSDVCSSDLRDAKTKFRKVYQEIDDVPAFEPVTKWNATVDAVERFPDMVRQAFRVATSGAPGPVHLQFRGNEGQIDQEEAELEPLVEPQFARVPPYRPLPDPQALANLLTELQGAGRPVIVAGGGVRASGARAQLVQLAEVLQIPVATSLNAKDCIPGTHPLSVGVVGSYSRESANRVVAAADLVCFIGTAAGGMTTHAWAVPKIGTPAVQIDIEPEHA